MSSDVTDIRIPDALQVNELLLEFMTARAVKREKDLDAFIESSNRTNILIMEVFKGLIANNRV